MSDASEPLVWLPFDPQLLAADDRSGDGSQPPAGFRYEVVESLHQVPETVRDVEIWVPPYSLDPQSTQVLAQMSSLRVVQTLTAGVDNLRADVPDGVLLCRGRGIHETSTAELAVTLTLAALRDVPGFVRAQDARRWRARWRESLADKQVLLVGYGSIGEAIEARVTPFECEVVRVARSARDGVHSFEELPNLLPDADVVILVVPLTEQTRGLVDADFLDRMKQGALIVNVSRGPVLVTDVLVAALRKGQVRAALDVTDPEPLPEDHPIWAAPGVLLTPHVGGMSSAMWPRAYRLVCEQLTRIAAGEDPVNIVTGAY